MANTIYRGESKALVFTLTDDGGTPANLTGAVATFRLAKSFGVAPLITKSGSIPAPLTGKVTVLLDEVDTEDLEFGPHIYELVVVKDGDTYVSSQGTIDILQAVFNP
jgi:hypothetical protein